jgi:hypothetical protein
MLIASRRWYLAAPGVTATGPFNLHFVRDIGAAYLVAALGAGWFAVRPRQGWPALVGAAGFLVLHGLIHVADAVQSPVWRQDLMRDLPGVFLCRPWRRRAWRPFPHPPKERSMLKAILRKAISDFERTWGYDASYMRDLLNLSPWCLIKFGLVASLGRRREAPAMAAAGIVGVLAEDCGPCAQISVDIASKAGVPPAILRAILAADEAGMGPDAALAFRFAHASLARDLESAEALREEIVRRWGEKALVAIGLALTTARMYRTLKYALGHGRACSKVVVAGDAASFRRAQPLAA